ncbi:2Fe-2S iron-sulfur cluster-binding protein [Candidatus Spongiisocius sp.]|uniref:2Fe-2S iron-sulfur cluster-binding protein n=1 Tax=Candidatus Spongiisocius sp. TaxID=3101273 RepID=UPI003B5A25A5
MIDFDRTPVPFEEGDTVLTAVLRTGLWPWRGCLCAEGDCPYCLVTLEGTSYVRACRTPAVEGMRVESHPAGGYPALPPPTRTATPGSAVGFEMIHCDTVVIGQGRSGRAAAAEACDRGRRVVTLDASVGREAVGVYPGLEVVARTPEGMARIFCEEVVVATGSVEVQPVCPGNRLAGILTRRAAERLVAAGVELGRVVSVGVPPDGVDHEPARGRLARFVGDGTVERVVTIDEETGAERTYPCDTAVVGLGSGPRDTLARMAHGLPGVRTVGSAAGSLDRPPVPEAGVVCPCSEVTVDDLRSVWDRGFHELELIKRSTLAGTGACQGAVCMPHVRSFAAADGQELPPSFTARPVVTQITMGEAAAGWYHHADRRTALHDEHLAQGAVMERSGGWWRPWTYGDADREYWAVRSGVSICDVSTLGRILVSGPDAEAFLERIYPATITPISPGRAKYVLVLDERGYVFDDGLVCREDANRFLLTATSAGAGHFEMWLRDWADAWSMDVRILDRTTSWGAVNVTGPRSRELLSRLGEGGRLPSFMGHTRMEVAGVACRVMRMSFTGEISYELHHQASRSQGLWRALMESGADLDVWPHGLEVLEELRLEKGHILVGVDSLSDSTPRRLGHGWAVRMDKGEFVGRHAVSRTSQIEPDRLLVGLEMGGAPPPQGAILRVKGDYAGFVTSCAWSRVLGRSVMLAWLHARDGGFGGDILIEGRPARRAPVPFYDPEGLRVRA